MYADIGRRMLQCLVASILALYILLGLPRSEVPDVVSRDKLNLLCRLFGMLAIPNCQPPPA